MNPQSIMVVDDDDSVRNMLCVILREEGYAAVGAADGIEALERMRRDPPSLVFLDLMMPRMDGEHLIQQMHEEVGLSLIPVAIMSGQTTASAAALAWAKERLTKPVELDDVLTVADRYVHRAER
jgi:CheY-like chemotaxis protein